MNTVKCRTNKFVGGKLKLKKKTPRAFAILPFFLQILNQMYSHTRPHTQNETNCLNVCVKSCPYSVSHQFALSDVNGIFS